MVLGSGIRKNLFRIPDPGSRGQKAPNPGSRIRIRNTAFKCVLPSVPDPNPDPPDPHVFGPPGSGSISELWIRIRIFLSLSKYSEKDIDF